MTTKTKNWKIRVDPETDKTVRDWLEVNQTFSLSDLAREAIIQYIQRKTPLTSQFDEFKSELKANFTDLKEFIKEINERERLAPKTGEMSAKGNKQASLRSLVKN